jgi:hypothetical protein
VVSKRDFEHHQLLPFTGLQPDLWSVEKLDSR